MTVPQTAAVAATAYPNVDQETANTPPPTGKLGDHSFEPQDIGDSGRAAISPKPGMPPRKLTLVAGQQVATGANRSRTESTPPTPDSGLPPTSSKGSLFGSRADDLDRMRDTAAPISPAGRPPEFNALSRARSHSLTPLVDADSLRRAGANPADDARSVDSYDRNPFDDASSVGYAVVLPSRQSARPLLDETGQPPAAAITQQRATAPPRPVPAVRTKRAPAEVPVSPPPVRQQAAVIARAEQHPDVEAALHALRDAVTQAAPRTPEASRKTTRYTGARPLQNIARAQRHSKDVLHQRAMGFYKAAIALSRDPNGAASQKNAAIMLAALAQRAEAEGYEAVEKDLVKRVMTPLLHSLSLEALCQLARLNDRDDGLGDQILHDAGKLLGTDKPPQTADGAQARRQSNVASALLGLLAELSREHARAASWDGQVAAALEAARNGQHQRLDAALREMWQGDLLAGDIGTPRSQRLKELVERLAPDQQDALARMLGTDGAVDAATINFNDFTLRHLGEFETDPTMHRQMLGFIEHLRAASRATLHAGTNAFAPAGQPVPQSGADASVFPARITPPATLGSTFRRLRQSVASTFRRKATTRDAAKTEINKAVLQLIAGGRLDATHVQALQSVNDKLADKLGRSKGTTFQGVLVQEALSRLSPDQLGQLRASLTAARNDPHVSTGQDTGVKAFYRMLETRLDREAHIRRGAAALNEVLAALQQPRHPEKLVTALDLLADVHVQAPPQQSELDYYADALGRLGDTARATLQKRLKGREDIQRHMRGIRDELIHEPAAWLQYRHGQLNTLSVAARTKV